MIRGEQTIPCDHCERQFLPDALHPVIISGVQSYRGHLLTGHPEARRVPLCGDCYVNFRNASIEGMTVKDDEDALVALGRAPAP
jgi:hypothetical protein